MVRAEAAFRGHSAPTSEGHQMTQLPHLLLLLGLLAPPAATPDRSPEHGNGTGASPPQLQQRAGKVIQQAKVERDNQKSSTVYSEEHAKNQRTQEQAIAESGVNGFRSSQRLSTSPKVEIKPYLLKVTVIQSNPILTEEQRTEYWQNKAEALQKQLDELQKIEKSMMSR